MRTANSPRHVYWFAVITILLSTARMTAQAASSSDLVIVADAVARCSALTQLTSMQLAVPTTRIERATVNPPGAVQRPTFPGGPILTVQAPEHCEVTGLMRERTGSDGQHYAVRFHLRLPVAWNGRFLFSGGGGTNGNLGDALGVYQSGVTNALSQGFAVVTTDTGHDNVINYNTARQGNIAFGHDYLARLEHTETALDSVATTAKAVVAGFYGRPADHSYFAGCSNGGREGMEFAQLFPKQFDGIVAAAPAFAVPKAAIAEANDTQLFAELAERQGRMKDGLPDMASTFSAADFAIISAVVLQVCDADDGLVDGMVGDFARCTTSRVQPALAARVCHGTESAGCISKDQVDVLVRSLAGPHNSKGQALYASWPWDPGIGVPEWRAWKLGVASIPGFLPQGLPSTNVMLGSPALSGLFTTPPVELASSYSAGLRYQLNYNFDTDAPKIFATTKAFPRSGWDLVGARSTDLRRFRARGAKMLIPHGVADPIFSINDTIDWWNAVNKANNGKAASFVRVYPVPGMAHCAGGPATDQFDMLTALVEWVEQGKSPDRVEAAAGATSPWPKRTRPLCTYPAVARHKGGDIERSDSFVCAVGGK
jgi:feruloyl esterase